MLQEHLPRPFPTRPSEFGPVPLLDQPGELIPVLFQADRERTHQRLELGAAESVQTRDAGVEAGKQPRSIGNPRLEYSDPASVPHVRHHLAPRQEGCHEPIAAVV